MSVVTRITAREELTVPFTPQDVWRVLADVAAYPSWWPTKAAVKVLSAPPNLVGAEIEVRPRMGRAFCWRFEELDEPHSIRLRFFGGALEGPGGFLILPEDNLTRVRYEIDVFSRGLDLGALSRVLPVERMHALQMRSLLKSLGRRLEDQHAGRPPAHAVVTQDGILPRRLAGERAVEEAPAGHGDEHSLRPAEAAAARLRTELAEARDGEQVALRAAAVASAKLAAEEKFFLAAQERATRLSEELQAVRGADRPAGAGQEETVRLATELAAVRAAQADSRLALEAEVARLTTELAAARAAEAVAQAFATEETSAKWAAEQVARRAGESTAAKLSAEQAGRLAAEENAARLAAELLSVSAAAEDARVSAKEASEELTAELAAARQAARQSAEGAALRAAELAAAKFAAERAARVAAEENVARLTAELVASQGGEAASEKLAKEEASAKQEALESQKTAAAQLAAEHATRVAAEKSAVRLAAELKASLAAGELARRAIEGNAVKLAAQQAARAAAEENAVRLAAELKAAQMAADLARRTAEEHGVKLAAELAAARSGEAAAKKLAREGASAIRAAQQATRRAEEIAVLLAEEKAARTAAEGNVARLAGELKAVRTTGEFARGAQEQHTTKLAAELEAARGGEAAAEKLAREEASAKRAAEQAALRAAEEAAARLAAERAARAASEETAARQAAEEWALRATEADAARLATELASARAAEEAARLQAQRAVTQRLPAEADATPTFDPTPPQVAPSGAPGLLRRLDGWFFYRPEPTATPEPPSSPQSLASRPQGSNFDVAREYLEALSSSSPPEAIARFFTPGALHEEFPHRFRPGGLTSGLDGLLELRERDLSVFDSQSFELKGATGGGSQVAMEVLWRGKVAATRDLFVAGQELEARSAIFLRFDNGRIARQHIYACFEPWSSESERTSALPDRASLQLGPVAQSWAKSAPPPKARGSNFEVARHYLESLNSGAEPTAIAAFYDTHAVQDEFPNRLLPRGASRDLEGIRQDRARKSALLSSENFELRGATGGGAQVAMEIMWTGVVMEPTGPFVAGEALAGRLALFLRFRDGLVVRQRNYDCF